MNYMTQTSNISELISIVYNFRCFMHHYIYSDTNMINNLKDIILNEIPCITINYNEMQKSFTLKIKKSSLRKIKGYNHETLFYKMVVNNVMHKFLTFNKNIIYNKMISIYRDQSQNLYNFIDSEDMAANLCRIECYNDNLIKITL